MQTPFTKQFIIACVLIGLAIPLSMMGAIILALPMGLAGGIMLIGDIYNHIK